MKHSTHIGLLRELFASNQRFILQAANLNLLEYRHLIFESGVRFLEEIYPRDTPFNEYYLFISRDKDFWNWWNYQWQRYQHDYIEYLKDSETPFNADKYINEMLLISHAPSIEYCFHNNYQKPKIYEYNKSGLQSTAQKQSEKAKRKTVKTADQS